MLRVNRIVLDELTHLEAENQASRSRLRRIGSCCLRRRQRRVIVEGALANDSWLVDLRRASEGFGVGECCVELGGR